VATGTTLTINADTTLGTSTILLGNGFIDFVGTNILTLSSNLIIDDVTNPNIVFGGLSGSITVNGPGSLTIQSGTTVFLDSETINVNLIITSGSQISVVDAPTTIGSSIFTQDGFLLIDSTNLGTGSLIISNSFTNNGTINIDNSVDAGVDRFTSVTQTGILLNSVSGIISFDNTSNRPGGSRDFVGNIDNGMGSLDVNFNSSISGSTNFTSDMGSIDVALGATLTIDSVTTTFGSGTILTGGGSIDLIGNQALTLTGNFTIDKTLQPNLTFGGSVTVGGLFLLTIENGSKLVLSNDVINADLTINPAAEVKVVDASSTIGSTALIQNGSLSVSSTALGPANLNVGFSFTNNGMIRIDNEENAALTTSFVQTSGTLLNLGTINLKNTGLNAGGSRSFDGLLDNQGIISVNFNSVINSSGSFLTSNGMIDVAPGFVLSIAATNTTVDSLTTFIGGGQIDLVGPQSLTVLTDFIVTPANAEVTFGGTITVGGAGKFIVGTGGKQSITADTFNNNLDVNFGGELEVREGTSNINSPIFGLNGELFVNSTSVGNASVVIANGFTNNGLITLDSEDGAVARTTILSVTGGPLVNSIGSSIDLIYTGGVVAGGSRDIAAQLDNQGDLKVAHDATLSQAAATHVNSGSIGIDSGITFTITGTSFTNQNGGRIEGGGTLDVSALTFTNDGFLVPGGDLTVDTLTISGNFAQSASAVLLVDVANTGSFDVLNVLGDYTIIGGLDLNFLPGNNILGAGEVVTIVTASSITAGSYGGGIIHNLGNAFTVTAAQNITNVDVTINAVFDLSFDNTSTDGFWETAINWNTDTLPATPNNVLINSFIVTHGSIATELIASLTLQGTTTLNLTSGLINTTTGSTFFSGSTFNLSGGTYQADADLHINGTFNFTTGALTGTGPVIVPGIFSATTAGVKNVDTILKIAGMGSVTTATISGNASGMLVVDESGSLLVDGSAVNIDVQNRGSLQVEKTSSFGGTNFQQDGNFTIQTNGAGIAVVNVNATGGFTNNGILTLDSTAAGSATLNVPNSTLINPLTGIILSTSSNATAGNLRVINAAVDNQGLIQVDSDLTINQTGNFANLGNIDINAVLNVVTAGIFSNSAGTININPGALINIDATAGSTFGGSNFNGTGTIALQGIQTLTLTDDLNLASSTFNLDLSVGTITITTGNGSKLFIADGGQLDLSGDTIDAIVDFDNFGSVIALGTSTISSTNFNQSGNLTVLGDVPANANLVVTTGFTNSGDITLDVIVASGTATLTVGGTFINGVTGTITSITSNSSATTARVIDTNFLNQGMLTVLDQLTINDTGIFDNTGTINIESNGTLTITAVTGGTNNGIINLNGVTGVTAATTILDVSGVPTFTNNGSINGIGTITGAVAGNAPTVGTSPGLVTITEDFTAGESSVLEAELEGEEAGITYDQLAVLGTATLKGGLNTTLLNGYQPVTGTSYAILTAGLLLGSFDQASGLDFSDNEVLDLNYTDNVVSLTRIDTTDIGTAANDVITTDAAQSVIVAGGGNDIINATGDSSIIYAQAGDDSITVNADFQRVDGGEGIDTLVLAEDIDFTQIEGTQIDRIEVLSLDDNDTDSIDLDADAIAKLVDGNNELTGLDNSLVVIGNLGDTVNLSGDFLFSGESTLDAGRGDESFRMFSDGENTLFVSDDISLEVSGSDGSAFVFAPGESLGSELISQNSEEASLEDHIDLSGVTNLPSTAPDTNNLSGLNLSDLIDDLNDSGQQNDLSELFGGDNVIELNSTVSALDSSLVSNASGGGDALTTYFSDGSSAQFVIYANLSDGESFL